MTTGIGDALPQELTKKRCSTCKVYKLHAEFHKQRSNIDGLRCRCKKCHNSLKRERYALDPGHTLKREQLKAIQPA